MTDTLTAEITVTNTGAVVGEEVVQLYLHDVAASVVRPVKELKTFRKIHLEPGESKTVSFTIDKSMLAFIGRDLKPTVEPGKFELFIGSSSADCKKAEFRYVI